MLYDCHTYRDQKNNSTVEIVNYEGSMAFSSSTLYSVGVHPWKVSSADYKDDLFENVLQHANYNNVVAIGECGLDKLHANMDRQISVFEKHIELANQLQKTLIVHCVQAFALVLDCLIKANVPVIIHGVNNKSEKLQPFVDRGYFFSFGPSILLPKSIARQTLLSIPDDQILLETDDSPLPIFKIYQEAAMLKNISMEELILQVEKNIKSVFAWQ